MVFFLFEQGLIGIGLHTASADRGLPMVLRILRVMVAALAYVVDGFRL